MTSGVPAAVIADVGWVLCSCKLEQPAEKSFGRMTDRHALLVVVELDDGTTGVGEVWTNFPPWPPRDRIDVLEQAVRPRVHRRRVDAVPAVTEDLLGQLRALGRQWGALGPIYQAVSGLDVALWDAAGKRAQRSVAELLAPQARPAARVPVYASALGPADPVAAAREAVAAGVRTLKLKTGFDHETDRANLVALRRAYPDVELAVDPNQAWSVDIARAFAPVLDELGCAWLEEPVPADDYEALAAVARLVSCPVAVGENIYTDPELRRAARVAGVGILQPDVTKTGGISAALRVYHLARECGVRVVPHFLGNAVGQVASLHLVAASDDDGLVELDVTPNPLRTDLLTLPLDPKDGSLTVPDGPGLGLELSPDVLGEHLVTCSDDRLLDLALDGHAPGRSPRVEP